MLVCTHVSCLYLVDKTIVYIFSFATIFIINDIHSNKHKKANTALHFNHNNQLKQRLNIFLQKSKLIKTKNNHSTTVKEPKVVPVTESTKKPIVTSTTTEEVTTTLSDEGSIDKHQGTEQTVRTKMPASE